MSDFAALYCFQVHDIKQRSCVFCLFLTVHHQNRRQALKPELCVLSRKLSPHGIDYQLLWPVHINYPGFTTVCSLPLFRVCRVITGRTCLKLLFSRWQAGITQEEGESHHVLRPEPTQPVLVPQMAPSHQRPGWTQTGHGQPVKKKSLRPRDLRICSELKRTALHPGLFTPDASSEGNEGFKELDPDWTWSSSEVQSAQLWDTEWKVNRLDSVVCGAAFDERKQSAAAQWVGRFSKAKVLSGDAIQLSTCWKESGQSL